MPALWLAAGICLLSAEPVAAEVQLLCHRTANQDMPENTLESLEQAALLGCNVVEIDLRRTLDGKIVLNHDGILERLSDGVGEVEQSYYDDLAMRDFGSWMAPRFAGLRIALFEDALRVARERRVLLSLDIKDKEIAPDVVKLLKQDGMLQSAQFGGEWKQLKELYPEIVLASEKNVWVQPGITSEQVRQYHQQGKSVIANFSANGHEMDLDGMRAAVAAGVDGINVDYPRLGAEAVGRPVEARLREWIAKADSGDVDTRIHAILELSRYNGFALQEHFARWLTDGDSRISRAAAGALLKARPQTPAAVFAAALHSPHVDARVNAAWALGMMRAPASDLLPLLHDHDPGVLQSALLALGRAEGRVSANVLLPFLASEVPAVRGAAAVALARFQPETAARVIPARLNKEMRTSRMLYDAHQKRGAGEEYTEQEKADIMRSFRCQMEMMRAIRMLPDSDSVPELMQRVLRPDKDYSQLNAVIAGFQLWDHAALDRERLVAALGSNEEDVANRAEWTLVKAGPGVLPQVRKALDSPNSQIRKRAMYIVAWQSDAASLDALRAIRARNGEDADLAAWAIERIEDLHPVVVGKR